MNSVRHSDCNTLCINDTPSLHALASAAPILHSTAKNSTIEVARHAPLTKALSLPLLPRHQLRHPCAPAAPAPAAPPASAQRPLLGLHEPCKGQEGRPVHPKQAQVSQPGVGLVGVEERVDPPGVQHSVGSVRRPNPPRFLNPGLWPGRTLTCLRRSVQSVAGQEASASGKAPRTNLDIAFERQCHVVPSWLVRCGAGFRLEVRLGRATCHAARSAPCSTLSILMPCSSEQQMGRRQQHCSWLRLMRE